ncbi:hypothetical protein EB083_04060, partial [bacterium]|nr:hypothetical protein [bacterium]
MFSLRNRAFSFLLSVVVTITVSANPAQADPADVFPAGPYSATMISEKILYPSMFGVDKGLPVADVSGVLLPNGT